MAVIITIVIGGRVQPCFRVSVSSVPMEKARPRLKCIFMIISKSKVPMVRGDLVCSFISFYSLIHSFIQEQLKLSGGAHRPVGETNTRTCDFGKIKVAS